MKTTAADILIDTIYDWGVQVVFGLPGDGIKRDHGGPAKKVGQNTICSGPA